MSLLVAINAKYIHTNLAVRYLRQTTGCEIREYSINDRTETVMADIYLSGKKTILFSCYLWNIRMVLELCSRLKKADSSIQTVLGGPEVSFSAEEILSEHPYVDFVIRGEGEESVPVFLAAKESGDFRTVLGLSYREMGKIITNPPAPVPELDSIPFPYDDGELEDLSGRLIYYETSRGCPFRCGLCLSSATTGVRFLPLERVKKELLAFILAGVPLVKLVDRTFNADNRRAVEIVNFIKEHSEKTCFHFEVKAETMSEELVDALMGARKGLFQLEIGVQSTNPETLSKIKRGADFGKITDVVNRLKKNGNIHLHLDLIAGLPGESYAQFARSFDDVFSLRPHDLQLGFLKKLKGATLDTKGSRFTDEPPYEVIHSDAMSYAEILLLKDIEDVLEKYYNSGTFSRSLSYLITEDDASSAFCFFEKLARFFREKGYSGQALSRKSLYEILCEFGEREVKAEQIQEYLAFDYLTHYKDHLSFMHADDLKQRAFEFLKTEGIAEKYFPQRKDEKPTELYKHLRFYRFGEKVFAFDAENAINCDITADFS